MQTADSQVRILKICSVLAMSKICYENSAAVCYCRGWWKRWNQMVVFMRRTASLVEEPRSPSAVLEIPQWSSTGRLFVRGRARLGTGWRRTNMKLRMCWWMPMTLCKK